MGQLHTFDPNADSSLANTPGECTYAVNDPRFHVVNSVLTLGPGQTVPKSATPISLQITSTDATGLSLVRTFALMTEPPVPPTISLESTATFNEGQMLIAAGTIASASTVTATVDYGDGGGPQPLMVSTNKAFSLAHGYRSAGSFTTTVRVTDALGQTKTSSIAVTVINVAPTARLVVAPSKFPKKGAANYQGAGSDRGPGDAASVHVDGHDPCQSNQEKQASSAESCRTRYGAELLVQHQDKRHLHRDLDRDRQLRSDGQSLENHQARSYSKLHLQCAMRNSNPRHPACKARPLA